MEGQRILTTAHILTQQKERKVKSNIKFRIDTVIFVQHDWSIVLTRVLGVSPGNMPADIAEGYPRDPLKIAINWG
jgi:hypothetical protein